MGLKLIVGLGNPGESYANTRHNMGFFWVDKLLNSLSLKWSLKKNYYESSTLGIKIIKPQDYMNNSGFAVAKIASFYKIKPEEILVVYDDLDLSAGVVRLKLAGGLGGHNGLKSIVKHFGSDGFYRLRIGIGRPEKNTDVSSFVLSKPSAHDIYLIEKAINLSIQNADKILDGDFSSFMQIVHTGDSL